jgi:hypothetical protein
MPRFRRGIQYAAASRFRMGVSGILGRPVKPDDDTGGEARLNRRRLGEIDIDLAQAIGHRPGLAVGDPACTNTVALVMKASLAASASSTENARSSTRS